MIRVRNGQGKFGNYQTVGLITTAIGTCKVIGLLNSMVTIPLDSAERCPDLLRSKTPPGNPCSMPSLHQPSTTLGPCSQTSLQLLEQEASLVLANNSVLLAPTTNFTPSCLFFESRSHVNLSMLNVHDAATELHGSPAPDGT